MKFDDLVAKYIMLRDRKAQIKKARDTEIAKIDDVLKRVEAAVLKTFDEMGTTSVATPAGTAYISARNSATVADRDVFIPWVMEHGAVEFLENRVNKTAVEQYKEIHDDLPPGINWSSEKTINVRRS